MNRGLEELNPGDETEFDIESVIPKRLAKYLVLEEDVILNAAKPVTQLVRQGIYFLIKDNTIEYVGQTLNLYGRLGNHEKLQPYHKIAFLPVPTEKKLVLQWIEDHYIKKFQPKLNIKGKE